MSRHASEVTKDQLIEEFNGVVTETEHLLKSVATAGGEKVDALRTGVEQNLAKAKDRLRGYQAAAAGKSRAAAKATDAYVHEHPWQAIGVAAGVNIIAGLVLGLLLYRR
jgi:ElaB/YqjD/DUF883 family membrane-anchored ribosome-binding protein